MGNHPVNLVLRFLLEILAIISVGLWGWQQNEGLFKYLLAFGIPIIYAAVWGIFAVPNDPSRSGSAPIPTSGIIRLLLEMLVFTTATLALFEIGFRTAGIIFGCVVALHYILSYDRVLWLLTHQKKNSKNTQRKQALK